MILLIIILIIFYIHYGLFIVFQIALLTLIFFISNTLIGLNPYQKELHIIRIMSVILIIFTLYHNQSQFLIGSILLLPPFSLDKIHYVHDFDIKFLNFSNEKRSIFFLKNLTKDIINFLDNLSENDNYWAVLYFYPNIEGYENEEGIEMKIFKPIIINKDSCPLLLSKHIMNKLNLMIDFYYLDDSIINSNDSIIIIKYTEIEIK